MMPIGSTVIYDGKVWNNQVHGTQPVWGIKKSAANDESVIDRLVMGWNELKNTNTQ